MLCNFADLKTGQDTLDKIQELEKELGKPLIAFACMDVPAAKLTQAELSMIQRLEGELGLSLVAVDA